MRRYQELQRPVKAISKKGKKKRQPKETDEEDNNNVSEGSQPRKKRAKRVNAKKKIPDLGAQLADSEDEMMERMGDIDVGGAAGGGANGAYDILTMFDQDQFGQENSTNEAPPQAFDPMLMNIDPALGGGIAGGTNATENVKGKGKEKEKEKGKGVGTGKKPSTAATRGGRGKKKKMGDLGGAGGLGESTG